MYIYSVSGSTGINNSKIKSGRAYQNASPFSIELPIDTFEAEIVSTSDYSSILGTGAQIEVFSGNSVNYNEYIGRFYVDKLDNSIQKTQDNQTLTFYKISASCIMAKWNKEQFTWVDESGMTPQVISGKAYLTDTAVSTIVQDIVGTGVFTYSDGIGEKTLKGVIPSGLTKREALQMVSFAAGATIITSTVHTQSYLAAMKSTGAKTYSASDREVYRESRSYDRENPPATMNVPFYVFAQGTPTTNQKYIKIGDISYIYTETDVVSNNSWYTGTKTGSVEIKNQYLISSASQSREIIGDVLQKHYNTKKINLKINSHKLGLPSLRFASAFVDSKGAAGYVVEAVTDGRATEITLEGDFEEYVTITIVCKDQRGNTIKTMEYRYPQGYGYQIKLQQMIIEDYICTPQTSVITGTASADASINVTFRRKLPSPVIERKGTKAVVTSLPAQAYSITWLDNGGLLGIAGTQFNLYNLSAGTHQLTAKAVPINTSTCDTSSASNALSVKLVNVSWTQTHCEIYAPHKFLVGEEFAVLIEADDGYIVYPESISVTIGGSAYINWNFDGNYLSIPKNDIVGDIVMTVSAKEISQYEYEQYGNIVILLKAPYEQVGDEVTIL